MKAGRRRIQTGKQDIWTERQFPAINLEKQGRQQVIVKVRNSEKQQNQGGRQMAEPKTGSEKVTKKIAPNSLCLVKGSHNRYLETLEIHNRYPRDD